MRLARLLSILCLSGSFALISCGQDSTREDPTPEPPQTESGPVTGSWSATTSGFVAALALNETRTVGSTLGIVTGSGSFTGPAIVNGEVQFNVAGTDSAGAVWLQCSASGFSQATILGVLVRDTIVGALDGSGFSNVALILTHPPQRSTSF